jgi:hypothetical protein
MKTLYILLFLTFINIRTTSAQRKVLFTVTPADASILLKQGNTYTQLAQGMFELKLSGDEFYTVKIWKEGFQPVEKTYVRGKGSELVEKVILETRLVKLNISPSRAEVYVDGSYLGKGGAEFDVLIRKNATVQVLVRCDGFKSIKKTYYNMDGSEIPPFKENVQLIDRIVKVNVDPPETSIYADGVKLGESSAEVLVLKNTCVNIKVAKDGYASLEKSYCNKIESDSPPLTDSYILKDRIVQINTSPENANIKVEGKSVGSGSYSLLIKQNQCVEVEVISDGFDTQKKSYCNQTNMSEPPVTNHIKLSEDEAWLSSIRSDQANVNFSVNVNPKFVSDQAWKIISQIVMEKFDVIEITDPVTGYVRTAWNVKIFGNGKTIRTRCIVKLGSIEPLRYVVKLVSEQSTVSGTSVKEDENFKEWDRLLNTYKDVISEIQARIN